MQSSYSALSQIYDRYTTNVDYKRYAKLIDKELKLNKIKGIVLDAGCGTGTMTLLLQKQGYDMIGADISEDMLAVASEKAREKKLNIPFLCQDLTRLDLFGTVRAVVCTLDTINHIESLSQIEKAFSRFSLFTEENGMLIFDMNTSYKHREILADNAFVFDDGEYMLVWQNEYEKKKRRVKITTDLFVLSENGLYGRASDEFYEYDYTIGEIKTALTKNGYELINVVDFETLEGVTDSTERILFTAKKVV